MMLKAKNPEVEAMEILLKQTADRLGMDSENLKITYVPPTEETKNHVIERLTIDDKKVPVGYIGMYSVFIEDGNVKIEVDNGMVTTIRFDPPVLMPEKYIFTHYSTYNENYKVADYLKKQYKDLLNMKKPKINITGGDYTIYGDPKYNIEFFDNSGNDIDKIINYNFNYVTFCCDDDGKLFLSRVFKPDLSQKLGDYPIIDEEKAVELLKNKNYITTSPEEFPGEEFIRKIELIYRTSSNEQVFMPYYRIYIEMPPMKVDNGLNVYGAFYVPAVKGDYIKNIPVWNGSFN